MPWHAWHGLRSGPAERGRTSSISSWISTGLGLAWTPARHSTATTASLNHAATILRASLCPHDSTACAVRQPLSRPAPVAASLGVSCCCRERPGPGVGREGCPR